MAYQVVLVDGDQTMLDEMVSTFKKTREFEIVATYKNANAALGQSSIFNPNLFLIDVEDEQTLNMIPGFVDIFPDADIVGMMTRWNSDTANKVIAGGALGSILKPFTTDDINKALDLFKARGKHVPSRIVSFFSPKGRAGRTTLAAILALGIAELSHERVVLIDADLQFGDLPIFFDIEPKYTVVDATQDVRLLTPLLFDTYFHEIKQNVFLLSSPDRPEYAELVEVENLVEVVKLACSLFRYVLIDLPTGFNPMSIGLSNLSDTVFVMAMINNGFEIEHIKTTMEVFKSRNDDKRIYTAFTRVNPCNEEERLKIEKKLGYPVSDILPNEYRMISIANSGRLSKGLPMDTLLMKNITSIAKGLVDGTR